MVLSEEQGFPYWLARGRCYAGWIAVKQGRIESGLALLKEALSHLDATDVAMGNIAGIVGDAYARAGQLTTALGYVDKALRLSASTGEVWTDAELHRLKGIILSAPPLRDAKSAEMHFLRAIDIAQSQSAKLWELRAAISLARLWLPQGKPGEALELLTPVRGWFVEGSNVPDLMEADALTNELVAAVSGGRLQLHVSPVISERANADAGGSI